MTSNRQSESRFRVRKGFGAPLFVTSFVIVAGLSGLAFGLIAPNATATTYWGITAGYMGDTAIYMTTGIYGTGADSHGFGAYVLPEFTPVKDTEYSGSYYVNNTLVAVAGEHGSDVGGNVEFYEFYDTTGGFLDVHIPIAITGRTNYTGRDVECQYLSLTDNYLPHATMQILGVDNNGLNVTGTLPPDPSAAVHKAQFDIGLDALETIIGANVPYSDYPIGWYNMWRVYEGVAKVVGSPYAPSASGIGGQVIQSYDVINGTWWLHDGLWWEDNFFGPQIYVDVHINPTDFAVQSPGQTFNIQGRNFVNSHGSGCIAGQEAGALVNLGIYAYPAVTQEGIVYANGAPLSNEVVSFFDGTNMFTVVTNSIGAYRFFARPQTQYTVTASTGTLFGSAQAQTTYTTPNGEGIAPPLNLVLPVSFVSGHVNNATSGVGIPSARVTVTSPSGPQDFVIADSYGYYFFETSGAGTYTMVASASGYTSQTKSPSFAVNTTYGESFELTYSGGGGGGGGGGCCKPNACCI